MLYILTIIPILVGLIFFSKRHQRKVDDNNENMYSKKQHEYFRGVNKPEMYIDFKGRLIEADEHCDGLVNDTENRKN